MEQFDYTHAIFAGLTSIWRRLFIFISVGLLAHFVGGNIYAAPGFLASIQSTGLNAFSTLQAADLAWLPLEWIGTILMSLMHLLTAPFAFIFGMAFTMFLSGMYPIHIEELGYGQDRLWLRQRVALASVSWLPSKCFK